MRDLYLLSDCLFFPSRHEGFGLPVLEAAMHRMPVWCQDIPAYRALEGSGSLSSMTSRNFPRRSIGSKASRRFVNSAAVGDFLTR